MKEVAHCTVCSTDHAHNVGCLRAIQQKLMEAELKTADYHRALVKAKVLLEHAAFEEAEQIVKEALA